MSASQSSMMGKSLFAMFFSSRFILLSYSKIVISCDFVNYLSCSIKDWFSRISSSFFCISVVTVLITVKWLSFFTI